MVTEDPGREAWFRQARSYLRNADPVLAQLIDDRPGFDLAEARQDNPFGLVLPMDLFGALLFQIVGQQLLVAATRRILGRIEDRFGGRLPSAEEVLSTDPARFRDAGLSWRKIGTLRERLEVRKLLDRAKGLLQSEHGLSEPEAFRWIQKTSMDRRLTMRRVAEAVIEGSMRVPAPTTFSSAGETNRQPAGRVR